MTLTKIFCWDSRKSSGQENAMGIWPGNQEMSLWDFSDSKKEIFLTIHETISKFF